MVKTITARDNPNIKYVAKLIKNADFRKKEKRFSAEGIRLCRDALLSGALLYCAFVTDRFISEHNALYEKINTACKNIFIVPDEILKKISTTKTPQGIVFVCDVKASIETDFKGNILLLDNIQNPLNMGTILRTAEAFGINDIYVCGNSCDVYSPKVVRGSMGAVFRLNLCCNKEALEVLSACNDNNIVTCATTPDKTAVSILDEDFQSRYFLMAIGNEANGLNREIINSCQRKITIPMPGKAESLNAAVSAAIVMWELTKKTVR